MSKKAKAVKKPAATADKPKASTTKSTKKAAPKAAPAKPPTAKAVAAKSNGAKSIAEKPPAVKKAGKPVALQSVSAKREPVKAIEGPEISEAVLSVPSPVVPFAESKNAAIDALVHQIETAEARLTAVKRATNDDELKAALAQ